MGVDRGGLKMLLGIFIGIIIGAFIGVSLMCVIHINRINEAVITVKQCVNALEHERVIAMLENKDKKYINGMSRVILIYKTFFEEELR